MYFLITTIVSVALLLIGIHLQNFGLDMYNKTQQDWVDVSTYFNNALNPFLLICTIVLLYRTYSISKEELRAARKEMRSTRLEMERDSERQRAEQCLRSLENLVLEISSQNKNNLFELRKDSFDNACHKASANTVKPVKAGTAIKSNFKVGGQYSMNYVSAIFHALSPPKSSFEFRDFYICLDMLFKNETIVRTYHDIYQLCFYLSEVKSSGDDNYKRACLSIQRYIKYDVLVFYYAFLAGSDKVEPVIANIYEGTDFIKLTTQFNELLDTLNIKRNQEGKS
ncbi:hypothetical protein J8M20_04595 [Pseudoalteromonas luteoviolacea]|uniref:hypothetical protein n=1 Tax=Pseudoalteromonas luteoviolacea TaxID=43657 RepID=UPI001B3819B3|nr:hypothetical protein [Pseudoalteromonas luteoviolacea]MBQ4810598.1 hypothetical protein [Pseudoalteromonas luteoviolacea]